MGLATPDEARDSPEAGGRQLLLIEEEIGRARLPQREGGYRLSSAINIGGGRLQTSEARLSSKG